MKYGGWCGNPRPHLRWQFEVAPLAFVARAAGAIATDGTNDVMANEDGPSAAHERTPLFVGSVDDVAELLTYGDVRQVAKTYAL
jgi:fructose-1,6-bisphosphatase I